MVFWILFVSLFLLASTEQDGFKCPDRWSLYKEENTCIKTFPHKKNWKAARHDCKSINADLVRIESDGKQKFVNDVRFYYNAWIGLKRKVASKNEFVWLDDNHLSTYFNWTQGEPNNAGSHEDCVNMWKNHGKWNDVNCNLEYPFICEINHSIRDTPKCPKGWLYYEADKSCIKVDYSQKNWQEARTDCQSQSSDLVRIETNEKQKFVHGIQRDINTWIGLRRKKEMQNVFVWLDDTTQTKYTKWHWGEPTNSGSHENCVEMLRTDGEWNDEGCNDQHGYVCEMFNPTIDILNCPNGWAYFVKEQACIKVFLDRKNWIEARNDCKQEGADLVRIENIQKQRFVDEIRSNREAWIGLKRTEDSKTDFVWLDDTKLASYFKWATKEPNNDGLHENCVQMWTTDGAWNDKGCNFEFNYICEITKNKPHKEKGHLTEDQKCTADDGTYLEGGQALLYDQCTKRKVCEGGRFSAPEDYTCPTGTSCLELAENQGYCLED